MNATYAYDVLLGQLEQATTKDDVEQLLGDYAIYVRGMLENQHPAAEVTAERILEHVGKDVGLDARRDHQRSPHACAAVAARAGRAPDHGPQVRRQDAVEAFTAELGGRSDA